MRYETSMRHYNKSLLIAPNSKVILEVQACFMYHEITTKKSYLWVREFLIKLMFKETLKSRDITTTLSASKLG